MARRGLDLVLRLVLVDGNLRTVHTCLLLATVALWWRRLSAPIDHLVHGGRVDWRVALVRRALLDELKGSVAVVRLVEGRLA